MQSEAIMLDYATSLMGTKATWPAAAEMLTFCPRQGKPALEALLCNLPVSPCPASRVFLSFNPLCTPSVPHLSSWPYTQTLLPKLQSATQRENKKN